jgi:hypothetical protein
VSLFEEDTLPFFLQKKSPKILWRRFTVGAVRHHVFSNDNYLHNDSVSIIAVVIAKVS